MKLSAKDDIPESVKNEFREDLRHAREWRKSAQDEFGFVAGHQFSDDEIATLEDQQRPPVVFNRCGTVIDAVIGSQISNRQEVRYIPREEDDVKVNEVLTSAAKWFRDRADADDEETDAFRDTLISGMGWTETRLDYDDNPDGDLKIERLDPFEMVWDYNARKKNLIDARRLWRVRDFPIEEARQLFPEFDDDQLHAGWAKADKKEGAHVSEPVRDRAAGSFGAEGELKNVTIVHKQWWEMETFWRVTTNDGQERRLKDKDFKALIKEIPEIEQSAVKQKKKVRYQAFFGAVVLDALPTACPDHFNFQCITGKRDQKTSQWYGLVRPMKDPQDWANKWLSQLLHITNTNAKGGIMAERGAFEDDRQAETSWSRQDRITWMNSGSLSGPNARWAQKPAPMYPAGHQYLTEMAVSAIRDVVGVNLEMLGMREADQPGVLEYQRRQAGMTILQPLFDSLKSFRRQQGELILYYIQHNLSDGRLVKIVGEKKGQYAPLVKQAQEEFDIVVDEMPTSPNHKEMVWGMLTQLLPSMKEMLTPQVMLTLLKYSPLPSDIIEQLEEMSQQAAQSPQAQMQEKGAQLQIEDQGAAVELKKAQARKADADAQATMMEAGQDPQAELEVKRQEAQGKLAIEQQKQQGKMELERDKLQFQRQSQLEKFDIQRADAAFKQDMQQQQYQTDAAFQQQQQASQEQIAMHKAMQGPGVR